MRTMLNGKASMPMGLSRTAMMTHLRNAYGDEVVDYAITQSEKLKNVDFNNMPIALKPLKPTRSKNYRATPHAWDKAPAYDPFRFAGEMTPRLVATKEKGKRTSDPKELGAFLGALWGRPQVLAGHLGWRTAHVPQSEIPQNSRPGRTAAQTEFTNSGPVCRIADDLDSDVRDWCLSHELGHVLLGTDTDEAACNKFADAWKAARKW